MLKSRIICGSVQTELTGATLTTAISPKIVSDNNFQTLQYDLLMLYPALPANWDIRDFHTSVHPSYVRTCILVCSNACTHMALL